MRGGGRASSGRSSSHAWLPPKSDKTAKSRTESVDWLPPPSSVSRSSKSWLPAPSTIGGFDCERDEPADVPPSAGRKRLRRESENKPLVPEGESLKWTCPKCSLEFSATSRHRLSNLKNKHVSRRHPESRVEIGRTWSRALLVVPVSHVRPEDEVGWTCYFCKGTLPGIDNPRTRSKSALAHLAICPKKAPRSRTPLTMIDNMAHRIRELGGTPSTVKMLVPSKGEKGMERMARLSRALVQFSCRKALLSHLARGPTRHQGAYILLFQFSRAPCDHISFVLPFGVLCHLKHLKHILKRASP